MFCIHKTFCIVTQRGRQGILADKHWDSISRARRHLYLHALAPMSDATLLADVRRSSRLRVQYDTPCSKGRTRPPCRQVRHVIREGKGAFLSVIADAYEYEAASYSKARTSRLHIRVLEGEERPPCRRGTLYVKATRHRHLLLLPSLGEMTHRRMTPRCFHICCT